jgi:rhodanese-related sulfurtransferase
METWATKATPSAPIEGIGLDGFWTPRRAGGSRTAASLQLMDPDYTPAQVAELLARDEIQLIDVRAPDEHEAGRIAGGRLVELQTLPAEAATIARDRPVVFYCRSGGRSAMATQAFLDAGYDAHNMAGGLLEWHAAGLPLVPETGYVADS